MRILSHQQLFISVIAICALANPGQLQAQTQSRDADDSRNVRFAAALGTHYSSALSKLDPTAGGRFDDLGVGLGAGAHWVMREGVRSELLFGVDSYFSSNESNVRTMADDVIVTGFQLTPSVRLSFDNGGGARYMLGFGVGYYELDIDEVRTYWFGQRSEHTLWSDSTIGGYLSFDVDFPRRRFERRHGIYFSTRIDFADYGTVRDESSRLPGIETLGPNAGRLSDPTIAVHVGYQWFGF